MFHDASQPKVKKAKINIKMHIIFLGLKAKNVAINLHFVVPIFCESNIAMSYSSVLFQRDRRGKELLCIMLCFSSSIDLQACIHFKKWQDLKYFLQTSLLGSCMGSRAPVGSYMEELLQGPVGKGWGAAVRRDMPSQAFLQGCGMSHTFLLLFDYDTGLCAKWFKLVGLDFSCERN